MQPHLAGMSAAATCCLLQLLAREGEHPPGPAWMAQVLAGLEPRLKTLEALPALQLLQSLRLFHAAVPAGLSTQLQARLVQLVRKFDAMGVATMMQV